MFDHSYFFRYELSTSPLCFSSGEYDLVNIYCHGLLSSSNSEQGSHKLTTNETSIRRTRNPACSIHILRTESYNRNQNDLNTSYQSLKCLPWLFVLSPNRKNRNLLRSLRYVYLSPQLPLIVSAPFALPALKL
ncbi:unnamed protein product [Tuber aestivum]|uniref:Uncharacterized protein n=1 Tax=Tuber aestivum TaxID=59557 RepID=A0A292Q2K4_9PEZI|nr:unnamed protein product [Tuber aestivum]